MANATMGTVADFTLTELTSFNPGAEPMKEDIFHMGTRLSKDVVMLHAHHPNQMGHYFILVHTPTGKRLMVEPPKEASDDS